MTPPFLDRYRVLFHVTRRSALPSIAQDGLQSAAALAAARGMADVGDANREEWTFLGSDGPPAWLRWQSMRDHVLARRLPETISPSRWRAFINTMVFFSPSLEDARKLKAWPADRPFDQVIIGFETASLVEAGCDLRVCRWNNGYPDRARPPRIRSFADYRPIAEWRRGDTVREVTGTGRVPPHVPFEVVDAG